MERSSFLQFISVLSGISCFFLWFLLWSSNQISSCRFSCLRSYCEETICGWCCRNTIETLSSSDSTLLVYSVMIIFTSPGSEKSRTVPMYSCVLASLLAWPSILESSSSPSSSLHEYSKEYSSSSFVSSLSSLISIGHSYSSYSSISVSVTNTLPNKMSFSSFSSLSLFSRQLHQQGGSICHCTTVSIRAHGDPFPFLNVYDRDKITIEFVVVGQNGRGVGRMVFRRSSQRNKRLVVLPPGCLVRRWR
jgi:hypothetical protein